MPPRAPRTSPTKGQSQLAAISKAIGLLLLAGLYSPISQFSLSPVYGSLPASLYHGWALNIAALLANRGHYSLRRFLPEKAKNWIPVLAFWIPIIQFVL